MTPFYGFLQNSCYLFIRIRLLSEENDVILLLTYLLYHIYIFTNYGSSLATNVIFFADFARY